MIQLSKPDVAKFVLSMDSLFVYLDPRGDDVIVPPWLKHQSELCLQFGLNMPIPVRDLHVDDSGIYGELSFSHTPFMCAIPWKAVYALRAETSGLPFTWDDDRPVREVTRKVINKKLPPGWAVVDGGRK